MLEVVRYNIAYKAAWDTFVTGSKNGTFLFYRDYMEYHADRFTDHSLLFYRKGKLVALLPANEAGSEMHSHGGLTYGGIISDRNMKAVVMLQVFDAKQRYMRHKGFSKLIYKAIPHIYHQSPAEEDLYALNRFGATLVRRDLNSVIYLKETLPYSKLRKRRLKAIGDNELSLCQSYDFEKFVSLQTALLQKKYQLKPVHSAEEIGRLAQLFPDRIKLYAAFEGAEMVAGVIIYEASAVAHCQYIMATERGKLIGGLDALMNYLIADVYSAKQFFSFGISTEQKGQSLNESLIRNKESYGARGVVQDFYELKL